jgi:hypothetical protein
MNKTQLKLIEKLENATCNYDRSCQECLEDVECIVGWFDVNDKEKQEVVEYFKTEYSDYKWISKMIKEVFSYVTYDAALAA